MPLQLFLLGSPRILVDGQVLYPRSDKPTLLLLYLAYIGDWVSREALAALFWPDTGDLQARRNLRQVLHRAKGLWRGELAVEALRLRYAVTTDVQRFREALGSGDWTTAVACYAGELLEGLNIAEAAGYASWLELERESLRGAWRDAVLRRCAELEAEGNYAEMAALTKRLLEKESLAEDVLQLYLKSAYLIGQRDAALRAYESFAGELRRELEIAPLDTTQRLADVIRRAAPLAGGAVSQPVQAAVPLSVLRPPRLIGRRQEREELLRSSAPIVLIAGEPGIGKSRLATEVALGAASLRCQEGLEALPYHPVTQFIRAGLERSLPLPDLGSYRDDLARLVPEVSPNVLPSPLEAETGKARLLEALTRYLEGVRELSSTFGLLIDDLQWADPATLELLVYLTGRRTLRLLGTYRTSEAAPALVRFLESLRSSKQLREIVLQPLDQREVRALLADLIEQEEGPELFSRWLHQTTGGNPMFALETLKSMFEAGVLRADEIDWHTSVDEITHDYRELEVPKAITEVVRHRFRRLSEATQPTLQAAAVMREGFRAPLLSKIVGLSEWAVIEAIEEAEVAGLIRGHAFSHDLLRQSIYADIGAERRRLLHARVAEALVGRAEPAVLAEHWYGGGETTKAFTLWLEAADSYRRRSLYEEAVATLKRALGHAPDQLTRLEAQSRLAQVYLETARYTAAQRLADEVISLTSEARVKAHALNVKANILLYQGKLKEAARVAEACGQTRRVAGLEAGGDGFYMTQAKIAQLEGRSDEVIARLESVLTHLQQKPPSAELVSVLASMGAAHDELGEPEKGLGFHQEALNMARAISSRHAQIDAAMNLLWCYMALQRTEEGVAEAEAALALGDYDNTATLRNNLAAAYMDLGRGGEAQTHYELIAHGDEDPTLRCIAWGRLAELYHRLGDWSQRDAALEHGIVASGQTDFGLAHVRIIIAVLNYGSETQVARVKPLIKPLPIEPALQEELERALSARGITRT